MKFEKEFIYDSYSCINGKGTSFGVKRLQKFIRSCSDNYSEDCYVLKLDISGYFMSINKNILFEKIESSLSSEGEGWGEVLNLIKKIIFNDCTKNSIFKGKKQDYIGLPKNKSLFFAKPSCGLPIGNLTSQLFSNIYLKDFDKYMKEELKIKYYGRYVDDFFIIHKDKNYLLSLISKINSYLEKELELELHPKKIHLQHYSKGVLFLGVFVKPYRSYVRKRTIGFFYLKINMLNKNLENNEYKMTDILVNDFISIVNSYLGLLKHHKSYKIRKKVLEKCVNKEFWKYFYISRDYLVVKKKHNSIK